MSGFHPYNDGTGYGNYNGTSGGGEGGGFSNSQGGDHQSQRRINQTITPVTIRTILRSEQKEADGPFEVDGIPLYYVSFIGVVREVDTSNATSVIYQVEDGSGVTSIRQWKDTDDESPDLDLDQPQFKQGEYVSVSATIRQFNGNKQLQMQSMRKITDFNQVPYHFLSAVKVYTELTSGAAQAQSTQNGANSSLFVSENDTTTNSTSGGSLEDRIVEFIRSNGSSMPEGVPVRLMVEGLNVPESQIKDALSTLSDSGAVFSTSDEDTYQTV